MSLMVLENWSKTWRPFIRENPVGAIPSLWLFRDGIACGGVLVVGGLGHFWESRERKGREGGVIVGQFQLSFFKG